jgi:Ca2+-binding RTX toxin-like protein
LPLACHVEGRGAMRKTGMLVAMVAVMVALFATAAYAATIEGNDNANALFETLGDDRMFGFDGFDVLDANNYGGDTDILRGGAGNDHLLANDGETRDTVYGGRGFDMCVVNARSEIGGGCERVRVR